MKLSKSMAAAALTLVVAASPAAFAKNNKVKKQHRVKGDDAQVTQAFTQFDTNRDGVISRNEFPADPLRFDRLDTNRDGVLTHSEAQQFARTMDVNRELRGLDRNNDGVISRSEWNGDENAFRRLDRNGDGVLSQADRNQNGQRGAGKRFNGLDRNRDGVITRSEWRGNDQSFRQHDRNNDGVLSGSEVNGR